MTGPRRIQFRRRLRAAASSLLLFGLSWVVAAHGAEASTEGTLIDFTAQASRLVANDVGRIHAFAERSGPQLKSVASEVTTLVNRAIETARAVSTARVQTLGTSTYPVMGKSGRIESWVVRSTFQVESTDLLALAGIMGSLQGTIAVGSLQMSLSPEARKRAEDAAVSEAIAAFQARATLVAGTLNKPWQIKSLTINTDVPGHFPSPRAGMQMERATAVAPEIEAGETRVTATVSGQIELPR